MMGPVSSPRLAHAYLSYLSIKTGSERISNNTRLICSNRSQTTPKPSVVEKEDLFSSEREIIHPSRQIRDTL